MNPNKSYDGSIKELLSLSVPLVVTWLSTTLMLFADRLLLARYSLEALGAAVNAGMVAWGLAYGFQIVTEMAQVVVAQYSGAGQNHKTAIPSWQMLWLSVASLPIFAALGIWGTPWIFPAESLQATYFAWLIVFGPAFGAIGAGASYFIGKGRTRVVTVASIIGNATNIILDLILIFGIEGLVAPMGIQGAALATGIGMVVQATILVALFLRDEGTTHADFVWQEMKLCLRAGLPPGVFMTMELVGWGFFFSLMTWASAEHILITSICQTLLPLLACLGIGLQKGMASIGGHMIGAGRMQQLPRLLRSGIVIQAVYMALVMLVMLLSPSAVIALIASPSQAGLLEGPMRETLAHGLLISCVYLFFSGLRQLVSGLLSAAGDSRFLTVAGALSVWALLLLPTYVIVVLGGASVTMAQIVMAGYGAAAAALYGARFWRGAWRQNALLVRT